MAQIQPIYIDHFTSGLFTNRSALTVPKDTGLVQVVHTDTLIDGSNVEISARKTLIRRPGFPTYNSSTFGVSEWPLNFWSGRINSTLYDLVDTQSSIYTFDNVSTKTSIFTKSGTSQSYFQQVGNLLFFSDGTTNKKWDGVTVTNNGITAPTVAPAVSNLNFHDITNGVQTVHAWSPNYSYAGPTSGVSTIWLKDPNGNLQFAFLQPTQTAASASSAPAWSTTTGGKTVDGALTWTNSGPINQWAASTGSPTYFLTNYAVANIQNLFSGPNLSTSYAQSGSTAAWSGTLPGTLTCSSASSVNSKILDLTAFSFAVPTGATVTGVKFDLTRYGSDTTPANTGGHNSDVTIQLLKASATTGSNKAATGVAWAAVIPTIKTYGTPSDLWGATLAPADVNNAGFGVRIQIALVPAGGSTHHAFITRAVLTVYYTIGSVTGAYTSTIVQDSNGNLQRIKTLGTTGGSAPTWSTTIGGTTTDNTTTWECLGAGNVLAANVGWNYAYGFKTATTISTMSPQLSLVGPIIGTGVTLTGPGSDDTQCLSNDLYRNTDGGALLFFDSSDNNVNSATTWSIFDNIQDVNLNNQLVGPIAHVNDPPPTGLTLLTFYLGRMWGAVGNLLYFSAGPDCTNGDGFQSWPPANVFTLSSNITGIAASSQGLVVFTSDQMWVVLGGPQTLTFFLQPILQNMGLLSPNCLVQDADTLFAYTSSRQLMQFTFSGKTEIGFPIADLLQSGFDPSVSSLALHRSGQDEGLFLSDGSTKVQRFSLRNGSWSPAGTVVSGVGHIQSLETSAGVYTLLAGRPAGSGTILGRSLTSFLDGASAYAGYATIGSLVLSPPGTGTLYHVKSFVLEYLGSLSDLTLSVLPNEISGSFTSIPFTTTDPYQLPTASTTVKMRRHDWLGVQSAVANAIKHMQVKITFPSANTADELVGMGIMPHA